MPDLKTGPWIADETFDERPETTPLGAYRSGHLAGRWVSGWVREPAEEGRQ